MTLSNQELKDHIVEIKSKISYLEKQISDLERDRRFGSEEFSKLKERIESIKYDLAHKKDIENIEVSLEKLNSKLSSIELELPEFRLVKKLILGMIAFILTAFLGLIWNSTINPPKKTDVIFDEVAKRITEEYRKNDPSK